ncbi:MAG: sigma-70 family RNA polymerase sigma factor [Deltaproteobacteria bacterium]|nr:sigma-70 family RNA polymerase sigma factor [Deltaproteobacteria bacterium]
MSVRRFRRREKSTDNPAFLLEKKEEQLIVWQTLQRLKPQHREILTMKYLQGLRYDELSGLLDIPRGTVMSRLYHARKAFKDAYPV